MKGLSFTIDPTVRWIARESEPPALLNLLPLFWTPRLHGGSPPQRPNARAPSPADNQTSGPHHSRLMRNLLQARLTCSTHTTCRTNHTTYKSHSISTTQDGNGRWVAAFGRQDGELIAVGRAKRAVLETAPEMAEVIAIACARIAIDDGRTGKAG